MLTQRPYIPLLLCFEAPLQRPLTACLLQLRQLKGHHARHSRKHAVDSADLTKVFILLSSIYCFTDKSVWKLWVVGRLGSQPPRVPHPSWPSAPTVFPRVPHPSWPSAPTAFYESVRQPLTCHSGSAPPPSKALSGGSMMEVSRTLSFCPRGLTYQNKGDLPQDHESHS